MALMSWLMIVYMLLLQLPNKLHSQSDFTHFDYSFFDPREANLIYQGDAHVPANTSAGDPAYQSLIRLTGAFWNGVFPRPQRNSVGRVLYSAPIRLWDRAAGRHANFQTVIQGSIVIRWDSNVGDGMAFFVAPLNTTIPPGSTDGNLGLYNSTGISPVPLYAVEIDVTLNPWDPSYRHVGINVNSRVSVANDMFSSAGFGDVEARITYDARNRLISVVANTSGDPPFRPAMIATVEHAFDLRTLLPEWVQIGISASTGGVYRAVHDISRWSFTSFMVPDEEEIIQDNYIRQYTV